ncbi:hypothetical protein CRUP_018410 [Coryphaenoides rupestris]|nr:hypothetical protein CRUP_018410 [Coryphaenoides rupestris]
MSHEEVSHKEMSHEEVSHEEVFREEVSHEEVSHEEVSHEEMSHEEVSHEEVSHEEVSHEEVSHGEVSHEEVSHEEVSREEVSHKEMSHEEVSHEEVSHEEVFHEEVSREEVSHEEVSHEEVSHEEVSHEEFPEGLLQAVEGHRVQAVLPRPWAPTPANVCGSLLGPGCLPAAVRVDTKPWGGPYRLRNVDDRERWPTKCKVWLDGAELRTQRKAPGGCAEGHPPRLAPEELQDFLDVLDLAKTTTQPDYVIATQHWLGLLGPNGTEPQFHQHLHLRLLRLAATTIPAIDFSHKGPAFITWHRYHLLSLERELQRLTGNENFAVPYWNFATGQTVCDVCTDSMLGGSNPDDPSLISNQSRFANWGVGVIRRGMMERTNMSLPTMNDVRSCLNLRENSLEGYEKPDGELDESVNNLHNLVHSFLNGTSALSHSAANDPIFLVLHAFTDAIFDEWMRRFAPSNASFPDEMAPIGHNRDFNMVPFFPPVTNEEIYVSAEQLGYSYAIDLEGVFIGLLVLLVLFMLFVRQRRSRGFEPLIKADFSNRRYTEEA